MHETEIWIDVVCRGDDRYESLVTLFANHQLPFHPRIGESLSFYQSKGSNLEFDLITEKIVARRSSVRVTIDDINHYAVNSAGKIIFKTSILCSEIAVFSEDDARKICTFMTKQLGFNIDPYGINKLTS